MKLIYILLLLALTHNQFVQSTNSNSPLFPNELFSAPAPSKLIIEDFNNDSHPDAVYLVRTDDPDTAAPTYEAYALLSNQMGWFEELIHLGESSKWIDRVLEEPEYELPPHIKRMNGFFEYGKMNGNEYEMLGEIHGPGFGVHVVDWTQDGIDDLLVYGNYTLLAGFSVLPGKEDGHFDLGWEEFDTAPDEPPHGWNGSSISSFGQSIVVGDINHDGIQDQIIRTQEGAPPVLDLTTISIYLGTESGIQELIHSFPGRYQDDLLLHDFNRDGNPDLLTIPLEYTSESKMYFGNGDGTFQEPAGVPFGVLVSFPELGDFNGDGIADVLLRHYGSDFSVRDAFYLSFGRGDGTFEPSRAFGVFTPARITIGKDQTAVVDVNQDGLDDIFLTRFAFQNTNPRRSGFAVWVNRFQNTSNVKEQVWRSMN